MLHTQTDIENLQHEINKTVWAASDTFRDTIGGQQCKNFLFAILFFKHISDLNKDETETLTRLYGNQPELINAMMAKQRFVVPEGANFWDLYEHRHKAGNGERIDSALRAIETINGNKLKNVFQDVSFNTDKLGHEQQKNDLLRLLLEEFAKDILNLCPNSVGSPDIIGNACEHLIKQFAIGSGKPAGEFHTPPEVADLLATLLNPQEGDTICDPVCGSGSLLIKCAHLIRQNFSGSKKYALYGQELTGTTWSLAKMNLFLHNEDNHRIEWGDTIRNPLLLNSQNTTKGHDPLLQFDIVTANPPFSLDKWGHDAVAHDPHNRFHRGIPPKTKSDYAFISHMIETLKPGGRMGVVVPHGVLFRASSEGEIRQKLIEEHLLDTVIGLPEKLFFGTGIPAAILIFKKHTTQHQIGKVLFIDASREFTTGKNQNLLTKDNITKIVSAYKARKTIEKFAYLANAEEIKENDFNLNISRYVDTFEEEKIDLIAVRKERLTLHSHLAEAEANMENLILELGYK